MKNKDCFHLKVCKTPCTPDCERYRFFNNQLDMSNLPAMYKKPFTIYRVDADEKQYDTLNSYKGEKLVKFVNAGKNLYICSKTCGNAKTTWAAKILLRYLDQTWRGSYDFPRGVFVNVPTFLIDIKNFSSRPDYIERIKEADIVVWDDLAFGRLTDYEHEQLLQFIDYRIANNKSNIYTSNITDYETLKNIIGGRLASRIFNGSTTVEFKSDDFRAGGKV